VTPGDLCNFVVARQYSIVKELDDFAAISTRRFFLRRPLMSEFGGWFCAPGPAFFGGWFCAPGGWVVGGPG
jgi:hypothetical protein